MVDTRSLEISKFVKTANLARGGGGVEPMKWDTFISNYHQIKQLKAYPRRKFVILKGKSSKTRGEGYMPISHPPVDSRFPV